MGAGGAGCWARRNGRNEKNQNRNKRKDGSEGFHNAGSGLDFLRDGGHRTLWDGAGSGKEPRSFQFGEEVDLGIYAYASSSAALRSGADPAPLGACGAGGGDGGAGGLAALGGASRISVRVADAVWAAVPVLRDDAG